MADQLYLSLWFPDFRLESLPAALTGVLRQFVRISAEGDPESPYARVFAASAIPIDWTESAIYQRIFVNDERAQSTPDTDDARIENAVREATEQLHEDTAYEFEMRWNLWQPAAANASAGNAAGDEDEEDEDRVDPGAPWKLAPSKVRVIGFGPGFDSGSFEQNGHIRVDFGLDTPWTFEGEDADEPSSAVPGNEFDRHRRRLLGRETAARIQSNVEKLLAFTLSVEKHCGISSRLLWTESGEPLAEKLIAKLQRLN